MKRINALLSIMLVFMLAFAAVPSFATDANQSGGGVAAKPNDGKPLNIIIKADDFTYMGKSDRYAAYQLFVGDLYIAPEEGSEPTLANIVWGENIDVWADNAGEKTVDNAKVTKLLQALADKEIINWKAGDEVLTAAKLAREFEAMRTDAAKAKLLADVLAKFTVGTPETSKWSKYDEQTQKYVEAKNASEADSFMIGDLEPGYYIIKDEVVFPDDATAGDKYDALTEYLLEVVSDGMVIELKADIPKVDKEIVDPTGEEAPSYDIGETITYRLTGTLPENYSEFKSYYYKFTDVISKGLTLDEESVKVYVKDDENAEAELVDANKYTQTVEKDNDGQTSLVIEFEDLKQSGLELTHSSLIVVEYQAKLNEDAVIAGEGNPNVVKLTYSNDPEFDGDPKDNPPTSDTPDVEVRVYTFGIDVTKLDGDDETLKTPKEGAGFVLSKVVNDGTADKTYYATVDENHKLTGWTDDIEKATVLTSDKDGKILVDGLDEGTYTLTEVVTPDGYDTVNPIEFTITATYKYDEPNNGTKEGEPGYYQLKLLDKVYLEVTKDTAERDDITFGGELTDKDPETDTPSATDVWYEFEKTANIKFSVINFPAPVLPRTGGIGTIIFYTVGAALIVAAIVGGIVMILNSRKKNQKAN